MTPVKTFNIVRAGRGYVPNMLWKSEGRDHTEFKGGKQVIMTNYSHFNTGYWQHDVLHCIVSANIVGDISAN